ncbi:hypothetical protein ONZ43_g3585 [Nemania bipapillata]|uniref:Uncharacterized protein n=1 Tax=Nemania bipapillata TaxID=110536 RepID=A0ACC2IW67_9PEZI|nr:hypothetical protein ONZ43_g3585 [Nemania bipapillata]
MNRHFKPTYAALEGDAGRKAHQDYMSRAWSSTDWRQRVLAPATTPPSFRVRSDDITKMMMAMENTSQHKVPGPSPNYRGDPTIASNQSADIPNSKNTSLWVTGLPHQSASYSGLMDLLKGRGKILATYINEAVEEHRTSAATITFFRHTDAANVMQAINDGTLRAPHEDTPTPEYQEPNLIDLGPPEMSTQSLPSQGLGGVQLCARWNRVRVAEWKPFKAHLQLPSRVIRVRGQAKDVESTSLEAFFKKLFYYNLDRVICLGSNEDGWAEYEYRFGSWKNQAEFAVMVLKREKPSITVQYGKDPCETVKCEVHILDKVDLDMNMDIPVLAATEAKAKVKARE